MRGGARKGAGRKPAPGKNTTVSFYVSEETARRFRSLREKGVDLTKMFQEWINRMSDEEKPLKSRFFGEK